MTTTCDLSVDWNKCSNCVRFKERIEDAEEASRAASATLDRAYAEYREDVAAGRACIATPRQRAWNSYLDDLEMEQSLASTRCTEAINAWATSIHRHHRLHEDRQQKAEDSSKDVAVETEEMAAIRKDAAVDALVNIYGGHIDKWLEALRERTHAQTDADDVRTPCACAMCTTLDKDSEDAEPTAAERDAYFAARDHADDTDTPDAPGRRTAVRIVAYDAHKGGCHEVDPTDVPVWLLDTPNTAIARITRQATLQEIRTLIDDLIDGPNERGEGES
ncbi:hypothetical protein PG2072B_0968 [Bifidobacterium pseudolongum subsp. globosum]|uniref:Uncharacterized protein n=1 Tax=Bifidobacterium pseudolongum subsp. globosum TaxID=1690 RepID=A0A4Q5BC47_9BIFI|nr:hypothetical protein [Bifidobacterium pseudolongum]MCH4842797.1 hypothetical protein [Bifidobacterium pseudolongum]RYQ68365.1 hypothetical protein PG2072B_0968 [Bifidobacterium pseudolongum subsp. globosum]